MVIERLDILNFKNIADASLEFAEGVNCLLGSNGMGKSNLLESLHLLSYGRPLLMRRDADLIRHGEDQMMVKGLYRMESGSEETLLCGIVRGKPKVLKLNGKEYGRLSEHMGRFPLVMVSPADSALVGEGGETRRKLMDMVISQSEEGYLPRLIRYTKALESRNRLLRSGVRDPLLYESLETAMCAEASEIYRMRLHWTGQIAPVFNRYYGRIAGDGETASVAYRSALADHSPQELLDASRERDALLGHTTAGIHRDDLLMSLGQLPMKYLGSQGQIKTFTIALRLAIFDHLANVRKMKPLLLLDDVFDKLDAARTERIMKIVAEDKTFGQIFVTDTNRKHLDDILASLPGDNRMYHVEKGAFSQP